MLCSSSKSIKLWVCGYYAWCDMWRLAQVYEMEDVLRTQSNEKQQWNLSATVTRKGRCCRFLIDILNPTRCSWKNKNKWTMDPAAQASSLKPTAKRMQGHNEVRWRPGQESQEINLASPCSNLRYFESVCIEESICDTIRTFRRPQWFCFRGFAPHLALSPGTYVNQTCLPSPQP